MYKFSYAKHLEWCRKNEVDVYDEEGGYKELDGALVLTDCCWQTNPRKFYLLLVSTLTACEIPSDWCEKVEFSDFRISNNIGNKLSDIGKFFESIRI